MFQFSTRVLLSTFLIAMFCSTVIAAVRPQAKYVLVKNGKPAATILVAKKQTKSAAFALDELQYHIRKMTGTALPVAYEGQKVKGLKILLGQSSATRAIKSVGKPLSSQEYMVKFTSDAIVIMGKDEPISGDEKDILPRVKGKFGKAIKFDGIRSFFNINDPKFTDDEGTLEAWIWMPAKTRDTDGTILRLDGGSPWTYHIVQRLMNTSCIDYRIYDGTGGGQIVSTPLAEGWHHVMATHSQSAGKFELFVDGVSQGTMPIRKTSCANTALYVGGLPRYGQGVPDQAGNAFEGMIDEIRISSVVRTVKPGGPRTPFVDDDYTSLLLHLDEPSGRPGKMSGVPDASTAPDYFTEKGTMDAVYEFLERFCGVDWCAPGEIGLIYPKTKTLTVKAADIRRKPDFRYRWMTPSNLYMPTPDERISDNEAALWKYRMRLGGEPFWACHSFQGYYERFLKDHPDWFAQGYSGEPPQMCYTNQGFIDQITKDAKEYFSTGKAYPGASIAGPHFGLVPQDNGSWCQCPNCQAKMTESEKDNPQFSNGKISNYLFEFINKVAVETRKTNPDKWISALAYSDYAYYPDNIKLEPNISLMMCLHTRNWWCPSMEVNDMKVFNQWTSKESGKRPLYVWLYYCFPALNAKYDQFAMFPGFFVHTLDKQTKMYHKAGIRGIFLEHSSEFDQTYLGDQVELYVQWRLTNNVNQNVETLVNRFFKNYYGKAAEPMKKLYLDMERTFTDPKTYPEKIQKSPAHNHQSRELTYEYEATPERMAKYVKLIAEAKSLAENDTERERVELFDRGIIQPLVDGIEKYREFKKNLNAILPKVTVPKVENQKPGDLSTVDWSKAADLGTWKTVAGDSSDRKISSKIMHDGVYLYIELSEEMETAKLLTGARIWNGDDWELFFAGKRESPYRQFLVDSKGKSEAISYGAGAAAWESAAAVSSDITAGDKWQVRIAFPLSKLLFEPLADGDVFYANFYRATGGTTGLMAWSPNMKGSFHELGRMGEFILEK